MNHSPTRRDVLKWTAGTAAVVALSGVVRAADPPPPRKVLFFTKSSGFQHDVINRRRKELAFAERALIDQGKGRGLTVIATKDGSVFTDQGLAEFDAIAFYTTGDLTQKGTDGQPPMPTGGKQALIDFVHAGKGFVGIHCATDTFHSPKDKLDPYIQLLGGEFVAHGIQQPSTSHVVDAKFPGAPAADFTVTEEWYAINHVADDVHVILTQQTGDMEGEMYRRDPYPSTWARAAGKGRVFYTSMGHREDVWTNPTFTDLLLGGLTWAAGAVADVDVAANLKAASK